MANPYDTLSPEDYAQQQQINRQQKMAEMLMSQNQQPQGQMVSGRYVAPSFFQNIQPVANMLTGAYLSKQGDTQQQALAEAIRGRNATELQDILGKQFGSADFKPAVPYPTKPVISEGSDMVDNQKVVMPSAYNQVGQAPDANAAFMAASQARSPQGQALFQTLLAQKLKPPELINVPQGGTVGQRKADGTFETLFQNPKERVAAGVNLAAAQRLGLPENPDLWTQQQRQAIDDEVSKKVKAGAPSSTTYVSAANKFAGGFGEKFSGVAIALYEAAQNAPQQIENAKRTIDLVNSGALTGPTANVGLAAAKLFNVLGSDNKDTIKQTELLFSNRGKALLGSVKQSGLAGSQGLTEGERKFLTAAEGGSITLNAETLKAMAGLEIKTAVQNQKKWNAQAARMDKDILKVTGAEPVPVYTGIGTVDQKTVDKF